MVMQGRMARALLLFQSCGQLMIDHGPISDFNPQRLNHPCELYRRIQQLLRYNIIVVEAIPRFGKCVTIRRPMLAIASTDSPSTDCLISSCMCSLCPSTSVRKLPGTAWITGSDFM